MLRIVAHLVGLLASASAALPTYLVLAHVLFPLYPSPRNYNEESGILTLAAAMVGGGFAVWMLGVSMARPEAGSPPPSVEGSFGRTAGYAALTAALLLAASLALILKRNVVGDDGDGTLIIGIPATVLACAAVAPYGLAARSLVHLGATPASYSVAGLRRVVVSLGFIAVGVVLLLSSIDELKGSEATWARTVAVGLLAGGVGGLTRPLWAR